MTAMAVSVALIVVLPPSPGDREAPSRVRWAQATPLPVTSEAPPAAVPVASSASGAVARTAAALPLATWGALTMETTALEPGRLPDAVAEPPPRRSDAGEGATSRAASPWTADRALVRLTSDPPGAEVRVDGRFRGRTPAKLLLDPGPYALRLSLGRAHARVRLTADRASESRLCFTHRDEDLLRTACD